MRFSFAFFIVVLVMGIGTVFAINRVSEGFRIEMTQKKEIVAYNDCKNITNQSNFAAVFIPTGSEAEWRDMLQKRPAHLNIQECDRIWNSDPDIFVNEKRDARGRIVEIELGSIGDNYLSDGFHDKIISLLLSTEHFDSLSNIWYDYIQVDDYVELIINNRSVMVIPYKWWDISDLTLCNGYDGVYKNNNCSVTRSISGLCFGGNKARCADINDDFLWVKEQYMSWHQTWSGNPVNPWEGNVREAQSHFAKDYPRKNLKEFLQSWNNQFRFKVFVGDGWEFFVRIRLEYD